MGLTCLSENSTRIELNSFRMGNNYMKEKKKWSISIKVVIQALPIAAAAGSVFLPLQRFGQQLAILIVLLWIQAFFIIECFVINK
jgi:hypothetical protein